MSFSSLSSRFALKSLKKSLNPKPLLPHDEFQMKFLEEVLTLRSCLLLGDPPSKISGHGRSLASTLFPYLLKKSIDFLYPSISFFNLSFSNYSYLFFSTFSDTLISSSSLLAHLFPFFQLRASKDLVCIIISLLLPQSAVLLKTDDLQKVICALILYSSLSRFSILHSTTFECCKSPISACSSVISSSSFLAASSCSLKISTSLQLAQMLLISSCSYSLAHQWYSAVYRLPTDCVRRSDSRRLTAS